MGKLSKMALAAVLAGGLATCDVSLAQDGPGFRGGKRGRRMRGHGMRGMRGHGMHGMRGRGFGMRGKGRGAPMGRFRRDLKLTDKQTKEIEAVHQGFRDKASSARKKVAEARRSLRDAADTGDKTRIRQAAESLGKAMGDQALLRADQRAACRKVLTPEQRKRMDALKAQRRVYRDKMRKAREAWIEARRARPGKADGPGIGQ